VLPRAITNFLSLCCFLLLLREAVTGVMRLRLRRQQKQTTHTIVNSDRIATGDGLISESCTSMTGFAALFQSAGGRTPKEYFGPPPLDMAARKSSSKGPLGSTDSSFWDLYKLLKKNKD
jgi:hypothetical protein